MSQGTARVQCDPWPRFRSFPSTQPPPLFITKIAGAFAKHEDAISTLKLKKGKESDQVLKSIGPSLHALKFDLELSKQKRIPRPVFFGEQGNWSLRYEIDGYNPEWRCGLEVEAGRALGGNAIFRDLFQAMVMTDVDHLVLAVPLCYRRRSGGRLNRYEDYKKTVTVAEALYGHDRIQMPYGLTVLGY